MKILLLGLSTWLLFGACDKKNDGTAVKTPEPPATIDTASYTYLALGDSYTIGQSVQTSQNFPNQLVDALKAVNVNASAKIIAQTGWTTSDLISAINNSDLNSKYDFVTLLIGVNNQYRGYNIDIYKKEFVQLLQTSIKYAGGNPSHVFVLSIPDYSVTPFAGNNEAVKQKIATELDAYNQIAKDETEKLKANYLDTTPISREAKNNPDLIAFDGLHPSATMYQKWVKLLSLQVQAYFK